MDKEPDDKYYTEYDMYGVHMGTGTRPMIWFLIIVVCVAAAFFFW